MPVGGRLLRFAGLVADRDRALGDTPDLDGGGALAAGFAAAPLIPAEADPADRPGAGYHFRLPTLIW